ncbi:type IV pilus twitching motility protein PilT [Patescibacteria group bacterium]|nr:type IV pilus twitching motility protein PilT [Patescibacteria group bacterium]
MTIQSLLQTTIDRNASDLHLISGYPSTIRIDGNLLPLQPEPLSDTDIAQMLSVFLTPDQKKIFEQNHELDFGYTFGKGRFRINTYYQKGAPAVAFRLIPLSVRKIDELNLHPACHDLAALKQGFVLVTGPTGHGKSTTIAAIIEEINENFGGHILTVEDPIEYIFSPAKAIVSQREVGGDTHSWNNALRAALREDPNVVFIGEMRDFETIEAALTIAETGHLVFATLHTNSAAQSIDRVVSVFPEAQQAQVRLQLSNTLEAIISQRLVPMVSSGRVPAMEVLLGSSAVRSVIREGKTHLLDNIIQTSMDAGMCTMDMSLARLAAAGKISYETALAYANSPEDLNGIIKSKSVTGL